MRISDWSSDVCSSDLVKPGSMGRPVPGHRVAVVGDEGNELPAGAAGTIAVRRPDPVMFLEYWRNPEATAAKFRGDWLMTGDRSEGRRGGKEWVSSCSLGGWPNH